MIWNCILYAIKEIRLNQIKKKKFLANLLAKKKVRQTMNVGLTTKKLKKIMHKHFFLKSYTIGLLVIDLKKKKNILWTRVEEQFISVLNLCSFLIQNPILMSRCLLQVNICM